MRLCGKIELTRFNPKTQISQFFWTKFSKSSTYSKIMRNQFKKCSQALISHRRHSIHTILVFFFIFIFLFKKIKKRIKRGGYYGYPVFCPLLVTSNHYM